MAKVILICGKICSGKSYYAEQLKKKENAVILSCDELSFDLFLNNIKDSIEHDNIMNKIINYLYKKAYEIAMCGANVILEFGFWQKKDRDYVSKYFKGKNISYEWHFVDISDKDWKANIEKRNKLVLNGQTNSYYLDEGLLIKLNSKFEKPSSNEMSVWFINKI